MRAHESRDKETGLAMTMVTWLSMVIVLESQRLDPLAGTLVLVKTLDRLYLVV